MISIVPSGSLWQLFFYRRSNGKQKYEKLIPTRPILWSQDEQECNIKLGSWTQDGDVVNLTLFNNKVLMLLIMMMLNTLFENKEVMDLSDFYKATSPYVVTRHIEGTRNVKYYQCCSEPYIDLNFR